MTPRNREVRFKLLYHQGELLLDETSSILGLVGGMGSGKTYGLCAKALRLGFVNAPLPGLFVEPTYSLVRDLALRTFEEMLSEKEIPYEWHRTDHILYVAPGTPQGFPIYLRSGDKPNRIIGFNAAWCVGDEFGHLTFEVFKRMLQRTRHPLAVLLQKVFGGTPEGLGWAYDVFVENKSPGTRLIHAKSADNRHLPTGYIEELTHHMSEDDRRQYLGGEFMEKAGRAYPLFGLKNRKPFNDPHNGEIEIWADFGYDPMVWAFANVRKDTAHVFDELIGKNTNTREQARRAKQKLVKIMRDEDGDELSPREAAARCTIVCDAAGKQHSSKSNTPSDTDVSILQEEGFDVEFPGNNPRVKDRVWSTNYKFADMQLLIDPEKAKTICNSFMKQKRAPDGSPDKKEGFDHGTDAVGYGVHWHWPRAAPEGNSFDYH